MDAIDTLIAARVTKPSGIVSGEVPVWNGATWVRSSATNVGPASLGSGTPSASNMLRGDGSWQTPPGTEIGYDQIVSPVTVSSAAEATGTTVITCGAHTFDGSPVLVEFFAPQIQIAAAVDFVIVSLFEGATQIGRLADPRNNTAGVTQQVAVTGKLRFTPTAGSHTYTVTAFRNASNGTIAAGPAGASQEVPAYIRFTKV
jgi:hypothetical protein